MSKRLHIIGQWLQIFWIEVQIKQKQSIALGGGPLEWYEVRLHLISNLDVTSK